MRFRVLVPVGAVALALTASADAAPVVTEFPVPTANSTPQDIVQAPDGSLWFTELGANKIAKVTPGDPPVI
jgi:glucose/arabinose dehydrogenase